MRREVTIARLGSQGDGIAGSEGEAVYIPFTLPGERVIAEIEGKRGELIEILDRSPERVEPVCRHFGSCGGCALQHLEWSAYLDWKRRRIAEALGMEGVEAAIAPVRAFGPHTRRRAAFSIGKPGGGAVQFGFRRAQSHEIVDLEECPVLAPRFAAALPGLRAFLAKIVTQGEAQAAITLCENGFDIALREMRGKPARLTPQLAREAEALGALRLTAEAEPLLTLGKPQIRFSGVAANLPPGAFLQASAEAEEAMGAIALEAAGKARKVADLFCGLGAFTFALARQASVTAVELDRTLLAALEDAVRHASGLKPVKTMVRDLAREPLTPAELKAFDAVLFDPPRSGALAQARMLAKSRVPKIVAVSCNPASFARDARILIEGGYRLDSVTPIDQFVYSPHLELIAVFGRGLATAGPPPCVPA